jgi:hypothetical protein
LSSSPRGLVARSRDPQSADPSWDPADPEQLDAILRKQGAALATYARWVIGLEQRARDLERRVRDLEHDRRLTRLSAANRAPVGMHPEDR